MTQLNKRELQSCITRFYLRYVPPYRAWLAIRVTRHVQMVRVVAQKFRGDLLENPADFVQSGWKHWTFIETLRRTVFLIHVINVTSARLAKQDRFFYEGVDDNLVLDMSLPAASPLWEASGEQEWHSAHGQLPPTAMTGRLLQRDNSGLPEDLDTFTRMIIHTLDGVPPT